MERDVITGSDGTDGGEVWMREFETGVSWYQKGTAEIEVSFPEGEARCQWCPFCRSEDGMKRFWCRLTNEMIYNPFSNERGRKCPIKLEEKKKEKWCW